ncbi:hypothetical protein HY636_05275 [Candidatus Woesearchaeota archaeon]|nr:hypothetical protein [Candidatus Woesearchaeota archaeon]
MLSIEEKNVLLKKLNEKKEIVRQLRSKLNEIHEQKEQWFKEKDKISGEIRKNIGQVKDSKTKRDTLSTTVKKNKETRDEINNQIKQKIDELKALEKEKSDIIAKYHIQEDPMQIKKMVEHLEFTLETNVMSFDKEKKLMDQIKALKKRYKEADKVSTVWKKIHSLSKEIETLKQESNLFHRQVQVQATQSQEKHETLIESSKIIKDLKKTELEAYDKFMVLKTQFTEVNAKLKEELKELNSIYEKLDMNKEEIIGMKKERQKKTLNEKRKEVGEKLKLGKKLTTEDILAFQSIDDDEDDSDDESERDNKDAKRDYKDIEEETEEINEKKVDEKAEEKKEDATEKREDVKEKKQEITEEKEEEELEEEAKEENIEKKEDNQEKEVTN